MTACPTAISYIELAVSILTLGLVAWYAWLTLRIARSAEEQAEASQKPVIVLQCIPRPNNTDTILERHESAHVPQAGQLATGNNGKFIIKNIGTGPCLNLVFDFIPTDANHPDPSRHSRRFPYIAANDDLEAPLSPIYFSESNFTFKARYQSLSGKKYITEMTLHERSTKVVVVSEDWTFRRL